MDVRGKNPATSPLNNVYRLVLGFDNLRGIYSRVRKNFISDAMELLVINHTRKSLIVYVIRESLKMGLDVTRILLDLGLSFDGKKNSTRFRVLSGEQVHTCNSMITLGICAREEYG